MTAQITYMRNGQLIGSGTGKPPCVNDIVDVAGVSYLAISVATTIARTGAATCLVEVSTPADLLAEYQLAEAAS